MDARTTTVNAGLSKTGAFARAIFEDNSEMDAAACRTKICETAKRFVSGQNDVGAIGLGCTYAAVIGHVMGRIDYSIISFFNWFQACSVPHRFETRF